MALRGRKLDRGNQEQSLLTCGGDAGRNTTDLVVVRYSDDFEALLGGRRHDRFRRGRRVLNVMAAEIAVNVEIGPDEVGAARQISNFLKGRHDGSKVANSVVIHKLH